MYCVGLTGQIGSGKSTVARYFSKLGIDIINADQIARTLTHDKGPVLDQISAYFGESILTPEATLDRSGLRQRIFSNKEDRQWLEQLLHPLIRLEIQNKIKQVKSPYTIIEIPLLINRSDYPYLNRILVVEAEHHQKIDRVMARDHSREEEVLAILNAQNTEQGYNELADDILKNTGSFEELGQTINQLHQNYLRLSQRM